MKYFVLLLITTLLFSKFCFTQGSWSEQIFMKKCTDFTNQWDDISFDQKMIKYFLVEKSYDHTDQNGSHFFNGKLIIDVDKKSLNKKGLDTLLRKIAEKLNIYKMWAFKTCRAYNFSISAIGPVTDEAKGYYKNNFIGYIDRYKK